MTKLIDWAWFKNNFDPHPVRHPECHQCDLESCDEADKDHNACPIWASLEDASPVIEIECSVCGAQITEYLDTGEREIREAEDEDG